MERVQGGQRKATLLPPEGRRNTKPPHAFVQLEGREYLGGRRWSVVAGGRRWSVVAGGRFVIKILNGYYARRWRTTTTTRQ